MFERIEWMVLLSDWGFGVKFCFRENFRTCFLRGRFGLDGVIEIGLNMRQDFDFEYLGISMGVMGGDLVKENGLCTGINV
jgi:hypothetical protein